MNREKRAYDLGNPWGGADIGNPDLVPFIESLFAPVPTMGDIFREQRRELSERPDERAVTEGEG